MEIHVVSREDEDGTYVVHVFATSDLAEAWLNGANGYSIEPFDVLTEIPADRPQRDESDAEWRSRLRVGALGDANHPVAPGEAPDVVAGALRLVGR